MKRAILVGICVILVVCLVGCETPVAQEEVPSVTPTEAPSATQTETTQAFKEFNLNQVTISIPSDWKAELSENKEIYYFFPNDVDSMSSDLVLECIDLSPSERKAYEDSPEAFLKNFVDDRLYTSEAKQTNIVIDGISAIELDFEMRPETEYTGKDIYFISGEFCYEISVSAPSDGGSESLFAKLPDIINSIKIAQTDITPVPKSTNIFADDKLRGGIDDLNKDLEYEEMLEILDSYIKENDPPEDDPVFTIKKDVEAILEILPECEIVTDEFEGSKTIYGDVKGITSKVNFVPFISSDESSTDWVYVKVGFQKSNWLFFEEVKIKLGEDNYIEESFAYDDLIRDVLKGSTIKEEGEMSLWFGEAEELLDVKKPVMRFIGEDEKTRDHTITDAELKALDKIYKISVHRDAIDTLIDDWEDEHR